MCSYGLPVEGCSVTGSLCPEMTAEGTAGADDNGGLELLGASSTRIARPKSNGAMLSSVGVEKGPPGMTRLKSNGFRFPSPELAACPPRMGGRSIGFAAGSFRPERAAERAKGADEAGLSGWRAGAAAGGPETEDVITVAGVRGPA